MFIKIHKAYRDVVALADKELIGKTFIEGKRKIELTENFFKDKEVTEKQAVKTLQEMNKEDATFYIVGKKSIQAAIKAKIISEKAIITIDNVPIGLGLF